MVAPTAKTADDAGIRIVRFLLDTNICSVYLRQHPLVFQKMLQHSGQLAMSSITWAELHSWAAQPTAPPSRLTALLNLASDVEILPVDREVAEVFGQLRIALRQAGGAVTEL